MGDLFFLIRMTVYTLIFVMIMQIKIGTSTLEQKVIHITHESQMAGVFQNIAQGAATFIGVQYNRATDHLNSRYIEQHSSAQRPGQRLKTQLKELKKSINKKWEDAEIKEKAEQYLDEGETD